MEVIIQRVNYIPGLKTTLLSSREITKKGWSINFTENGALLKHKKGQLQAKWDYNAYYVQAEVDNDALEPVIYQVDSNTPLDLYYKRLVHINKESILKTIEKSYRLKKI